MKAHHVWMALTVLSTSTAAAQAPGVVEIGGFARWTKFDASLENKNRVGGGGRLGVFFARNFEIELDQTFQKQPHGAPGFTGESSHYPFHARLLYNFPVGENNALIIGGGYVRNYYRRDLNLEDNGIAGLVGIRKGIGSAFNIRVDGTIDYMPSPDNGADKNINYGVQAGIGVLIGNEPRVKDVDGDGVKDDVDQCPATPKGEQVDAKGCSASQLDSDNDGVMNNADQCPNTPAGDKVDAKGCSLPKDADGDGVTDDKDKCPNTPAGEAVDSNGCGKSQLDSDNDGVKDNADQCPNTPAGTKVDAKGCPVPIDSDGDGVTDDKDRCPNTPAGTQVDAMGCRILFEGDKKELVLEGVEFVVGKAELTGNAETVLNVVAQSLAANPDVKVEVDGHTDITGSKALNQKLSQARANSVKDFLLAHGVQASQITAAKGFGPARPIASNKTADGRQKNRRVELVRINN